MFLVMMSTTMQIGCKIMTCNDKKKFNDKIALNLASEQTDSNTSVYSVTKILSYFHITEMIMRNYKILYCYIYTLPSKPNNSLVSDYNIFII